MKNWHLFSRKTKNVEEKWNVKTMFGANLGFAAAESYKVLRTNLKFSFPDDGQGKIIGFTSASSGDGKSLTCANMAISFAMSGKRVLVVDCDMRKPSQESAFGVRAENGLSEYLAGICDEPIFVETEYENLSLMTAGRCPPNPAELLYGNRFRDLIAQAGTQFDCVFIDLPPVGIISDAAIIAEHLNGYVLVVRANKSDLNRVKNAVSSLEKIGGKIIGFVLNDLEVKRSRFNHYGKYYYRRYYYGYGGHSKEAKAEKDTAIAQDTADT